MSNIWFLKKSISKQVIKQLRLKNFFSCQNNPHIWHNISSPNTDIEIFMNDNPLESHHFVGIYSKPLEYAMFFFVIKMIPLIDTNGNHSMDLTANINAFYYQRLIRMRLVNVRICFNPFIRFEFFLPLLMIKSYARLIWNWWHDINHRYKSSYFSSKLNHREAIAFNHSEFIFNPTIQSILLFYCH